MPIKRTDKSKITATKVAKPKVVAKPKKLTAPITKPKVSTKSIKPPVAKKRVQKPERTDVFVSYSHADKAWLTRLQVHLKPLERDHKIAIWTDTKLRGGDKWRAEIDKALAKAKVAILLISADFMASDFIAKNELPPLLKAAQKEGVLILPVIVGDSGEFSINSLSQFQALNDPALPLENMSKGQSDQVFTQLFKRVYTEFKPANSTLAKQVTLTKDEPTTPAKTLKQPTKSTASAPTKRTASRANGTKKALLVKKNGEWEVVVITQSELASDLILTVKAANAKQQAFLMSLRQADQLAAVVLGFQTYVCKNASVQIKTAGAQESWHIKTDIQQQNQRAQVTFSSVTPDMQAESRARLLLLNEPLPTEHVYYRHMSMMIDYESSPFPALYQQVNKQAEPFRQAATLIATLLLQVNNIVEHIHKLAFSMKRDAVTIQFEGERSNQYQTQASTIIKVTGTCDLSKATSDKPLRLGPVSQY